jgi:4-hydroxy-2-oxoheptanedioate aldolase
MDKIRKLVSDNRPAVGSWMVVGNTLGAETLGKAGYDFVIPDLQHGGITWDNLLPLIQVLDMNGVPAMVRVPWLDPALIMRAMDLGARGVIVPMVSTVAQAKLAAEAIRYPPHGIRSLGLVRNHHNVDPMAFQPLCFVMIETAEAMENLDAIAAEPGVDGLFVGPVDLAISLGLGPVLEPRDEIMSAIRLVVEACRRHNKISGSASLGLPYARRLMDMGTQFVAVGNDNAFIRQGAANQMKQLNAWRAELNPAAAEA